MAASGPTISEKIKAAKAKSEIEDVDIWGRDESARVLGTSPRDLKVAGVLTAVALFVRLYRIWEPSSVVFDEVHFGGYATK